MQRRRVGDSGLRVSRIGLGTMTWGDATDAETAADQLRLFVQSGGTLVETADGYGGGAAQDVLAGLLRRVVARDDLVLAARSVLAEGPQGTGSGRGALLSGLDRVLRRLGTDYLDLWPVAWDPEVPLDETLAAAEAAVMSGRVRYVGLVAPAGWQLASVAERARPRWPGAVPAAAHAEYSLLARGPEAELLPAAVHHGAGLLAWAPLGRGVLAGRFVDDGAPPSPYVEELRTDRAARILHAVLTAAEGLGTSPLAVALAWVRDRPGVAAAVVGARDASQLAASTAAEAVTLPEAIRAALDDVSGTG